MSDGVKLELRKGTDVGPPKPCFGDHTYRTPAAKPAKPFGDLMIRVVSHGISHQKTKKDNEQTPLKRKPRGALFGLAA